MSSLVSSVALAKTNQIPSLLMGDSLAIDLARLIQQFSTDLLLGYYFTDRQGKIIAGKTIDCALKQERMLKTWLSIPCGEIPQNAVTIAFFVD